MYWRMCCLWTMHLCTPRTQAQGSEQRKSPDGMMSIKGRWLPSLNKSSQQKFAGQAAVVGGT